jgi:hypothetical protein
MIITHKEIKNFSSIYSIYCKFNNEADAVASELSEKDIGDN